MPSPPPRRRKSLVNLAWLAVASPIIVGLALGAEALGGFLAGVILSGQLLAVFGVRCRRRLGQRQEDRRGRTPRPRKEPGKGSERHKASVVGDTVGDPLKDTAGSGLNPMIKVINLVSLLMAPIITALTAATRSKAGDRSDPSGHRVLRRTPAKRQPQAIIDQAA
ncbi:MAG: sodium/proton-translocating pyrophosphatase [Caldilineales bacterium]